MPTKIEWTEEVWNPIAGCTKISEGCKHCYAERMAVRLAANPSVSEDTREAYQSVITDGHWNGKIVRMPERLKEPLRWRKPRRVFVCSMSDLFHENVSDKYIATVFSEMAHTAEHRFYILTKRPERMWKWLSRCANGEGLGWITHNGTAPSSYGGSGIIVGHKDWPLPNVWLGVSIENQQCADERLPYLRELTKKGWKTFVSCEPLLGPIDFEEVPVGMFGALSLGLNHLSGPKWVIVGDESGPSRRPCELDWVRDIRDQVLEAGIPFFLKQLHVDGKKVSMPKLDGRIRWDQMPEVNHGGEAAENE